MRFGCEVREGNSFLSLRTFCRMLLVHLRSFPQIGRLSSLLLSSFCLIGIFDPLLAEVSSSYSADYSHRVWTTQDGLPDNRVQAIAQTRDGYLWIGTAGGLVRFDGINFTVFNRSNTPALADDNILTLCAATDGSLWIGTGIGKLTHFSNGMFRLFDETSGLPNGYVRSIYEDRHGTVWVGTDLGLLRFDRGRFVSVTGNSDFHVILAHSFSEDQTGHLWVGGSTGLFMRDEAGQLQRVSLGPGAATNRVLTLKAASDGLWVATLADLWHLQNGTVLRRASRGLAYFNISLFDISRDGTVWIGTMSQGLIRLRDGVLARLRAPAILPDNGISAILEDREDNIWIGTQDGLVRLSKATVEAVMNPNSLLADKILSIYTDPIGSLWLTTLSGQLYRVDGKTISPFPLGSIRARSVFRDSGGTLWVGTYGQGIVRLSQTGTQTLEAKDPFTVRVFYEDRRGTIWIGTGYGLKSWDGRRLHTYSVQDGLAYVSVRAIAEDSNGDLWIGTDAGLSRLHEGTFQHDSLTKELSADDIFSIHRDATGAMWLGTRTEGIVRVKNGTVSRYTVKDGLLSNTIFQVLEDDIGNVWVSTPAGIFSAKRDDFDLLSEGKLQLLPTFTFGRSEVEVSRMNGGRQPVGARTAEGHLWFPSHLGIVSIDPKRIPASHPAPVLIEAVYTDDRQLSLSDSIDIPPGTGKLEVQYTAFNFRSPEQLKFRYRLEGFDRSWSAATAQRRAYYTNLPPGQYHFRVIAINGPGSQSTSEASVSLIWEAHWYQTRWLFALSLMIIGFLIWAAFRLHAVNMRTRYRLLLRERTRLAQELHDTLIQSCVGISALLEAAAHVNKTDTNKSGELLDHARMQTRLAIEDARQAVWDLRNESLDVNVMDCLAELRQLGADREVRVKTETHGAFRPLGVRVNRTLVLIAREAFHNALRHARPQEVAIRLYYDPNEARIQIVDDGCGFDPAGDLRLEERHFGIIGMRERVGQMGGALHIASTPGGGTTITAALPLDRCEQIQEGE